VTEKWTSLQLMRLQPAKVEVVNKNYFIITYDPKLGTNITGKETFHGY
jgi:hypothetical protein